MQVSRSVEEDLTKMDTFDLNVEYEHLDDDTFVPCTQHFEDSQIPEATIDTEVPSIRRLQGCTLHLLLGLLSEPFPWPPMLRFLHHLGLLRDELHVLSLALQLCIVHQNILLKTRTLNPTIGTLFSTPTLASHPYKFFVLQRDPLKEA